MKTTLKRETAKQQFLKTRREMQQKNEKELIEALNDPDRRRFPSPQALRLRTPPFIESPPAAELFFFSWAHYNTLRVSKSVIA